MSTNTDMWLGWVGQMYTVQVTVILGEEVNIVEDTTVPAVVLHGLCESNIHQHCPVKQMFISLVDDVDPVVDILSSEKGMDMSQESSKLTAPVSVRDDNGHIMMCTAVSRAISPPGRIFFQD